jgi:hypothetical protein
MTTKFYRTRHRGLILRTIKQEFQTVNEIHSRLKELHGNGKIKKMPLIRQIYRTASDLSKSKMISKQKVGRVNYYF